MLVKQADQKASKLEQLSAWPVDVPVDPGNFVILAIRVVVALLGAADFVAREQHRDSLRQDQGGEKVALLARTQGENHRIVRWPFGTAVPTEIIVVTVAIFLAVRF